MAVVPEHDNFRLENQDHSSDLSVPHFKQTNVGYVTGGMQTTKNVLTRVFNPFWLDFDPEWYWFRCRMFKYMFKYQYQCRSVVNWLLPCWGIPIDGTCPTSSILCLNVLDIPKRKPRGTVFEPCLTLDGSRAHGTSGAYHPHYAPRSSIKPFSPMSGSRAG